MLCYLDPYYVMLCELFREDPFHEENEYYVKNTFKIYNHVNQSVVGQNEKRNCVNTCENN